MPSLMGLARAVGQVPATPGGPAARTPSAQKGVRAAHLLSPNDVLATVEGQTIRRRELVALWIKTDPAASAALGDLLAKRVEASHVLDSSYTISETEIYGRLFNATGLTYAQALGTLVLYKAAATQAARLGIIVTTSQARVYARRLFERYRKQQNVNLTDDQIQTLCLQPLVTEYMLFRLRAEKLYGVELARQFGRPVEVDDWIVLRDLYASATLSGPASAQSFARARERIEEWLAQMQRGASMEGLASIHNEDAFRGTGGLRPPVLRHANAAASKRMTDIIFALKPGETSSIVQGQSGWYVLHVEKRGRQIPPAEIEAQFDAIVDEKLPDFLVELRNRSHVTSAVPLPWNPLQPTAFFPSGELGWPPPPPGG